MSENSVKSAAVVIPLYKERLERYEAMSLEQCLKVMKKHPIIAVSPTGLEADYVRGGISLETFDAQFFQSAQSFGGLQLTREFYARFTQYEHILMYHLDSFVFSDKLSEWCARDFDYIGAPWLDEYRPSGIDDLLAGVRRTLPLWMKVRWFLSRDNRTFVGNGGFSLRKVATMIEVLTRFRTAAKQWPANQDIFWAFAAPKLFPSFKLPPVEVAMEFAFEVKPRKCYAATNGKLPFGCHDWSRRDMDFWRPIFKEHGYIL